MAECFDDGDASCPLAGNCDLNAALREALGAFFEVLDTDLRSSLKTGADTAAAAAVGKLIAERAVKAGVKDVVFDRGAFIYHGRIKALAEAAREGGLNF